MENKCLITFDHMGNSYSSNGIDAVITWVDGKEPGQKEKLSHFISQEDVEESPNVISSRFDASDEIKYCLLSIFKFAPFIQRVFIVTDNQKPNVEQTIQAYFPERLKDIIYVDHKVIFKDYEDFLPIFNSRGIETMLWRIPTISNNFLYLNDDFFIVKPLKIDDFIKDSKLILRGKWSLPPLLRLLWHQVLTPKHKRRASYHVGQWNGARVAGFNFRYFVFEHTPYLISKELLEEFFKAHPHKLVNNISHRFRNPNQFNPCSLSYHLTFKAQKGIQEKDSQLSYLQPHKRDKNYIHRKTAACEKNESVKFMCVQDLSISDERQRNEVYSWLNKTLEVD